MAYSVLALSVLLSSQQSPSDKSAADVTKSSATGAENRPGIYASGFEILSHEKNPDALGNYPFQMLAAVRGKWYSQIVELQKSIGRNPGTTAVDFEISNDGSIGKLKTVESTGNTSLDAAATLAILSSAPFARIPDAYPAKALKIRMHFGYDQPASAEAPFCDGPNWGAHPAAYSLHQLREGLTPPKTTYAPDPDYSEQALREKYVSEVWIAGTVDPQGAFTDLCVTQAAGKGLDEKAMEALKTWKFEPAKLHGEPVALRLNVEVSFRLY